MSTSPRSSNRVNTSPRSPNKEIDSLSLADKKKLLSLAKQLQVAVNRSMSYSKQAENLMRTSGISLGELATPTTAASRNIISRVSRLENMASYTDEHYIKLARKMVASFARTIMSMTPNKIIRNTQESILRHIRRNMTIRNIHSGQYQTRGRGWSVRTKLT